MVEGFAIVGILVTMIAQVFPTSPQPKKGPMRMVRPLATASYIAAWLAAIIWALTIIPATADFAHSIAPFRTAMVSTAVVVALISQSMYIDWIKGAVKDLNIDITDYDPLSKPDPEVEEPS
jgi:hypothetical protein